MSAAVPAYLQSHIADAPPGHRFGLYYAGWNDDFTQPKDGKTKALQSVCTFPGHSQKLLAALLARQKAHAAAAPDTLLALPLIASSPFATGLGNEHPLENGFSFLTPYGLPYLPGSGVKGVIRRAAEELASGDWGDAQNWNDDAIRRLFGPGETDPSRDDNPLQGALRFWDVLPQTPKASMSVEIMTPHLGKYYQGDDHGKVTPNTSLTPNPIPFLAVPPATTFLFHVECNPARIDSADLLKNWKALIEAAFDHAGTWLGFGAKTAVGYGRMELDPAIAATREAERERLEIQRKKDEEAARRAALPANERLLAQLESHLATLPVDPRNQQPIRQATSIDAWKSALDLLTAATLAEVPLSTRETLASQVKVALLKHFKVEGKAEKAMKERLAALRAPGA